MCIRDSDLTVTASGPFTFATSLTSGSAYAVAVKTQPSGETCTVSNGSGTLEANVTNVLVECTSNTYTVGGTVFDLPAGKSLLLTNNGGDDLTVSGGSGERSFTFATPVESGSPYAVAVKTQPAGMTCTVSNGSGTGDLSPITNVTVVCRTVTYSVGGTLRGLPSGRSVELTNNGGDNLTVQGASGSPTFTFPSRLPSGATYTVAVKTQPSGATCTVSNGSGTLDADVTDVLVSCTLNTYSVGGTITGLLGGKSLVLTNSGGDDLTVVGLSLIHI